MNTRHRGMRWSAAIAGTAIVTSFGVAARPSAQGAAATSTVETVATLPSTDTENIFQTPDGAIYVTGMDSKAVYKVTDGRVETFATVPSMAFVVGVAGNGDGFALTAFGRPFRRPGAAGQPPQIDFSDIDPQIIVLDRNGRVTATIAGQKGQAFNGIAPGPNPGIYFVADSNAGTIWRVDVNRKQIEPWLKDEALAPTETVRVGANGIKVHDGWVYVSARGTLHRVQIGPDGKPGGSLMAFAQGIRTDDFDIARDGTVYLSSMTKVSPRGEVTPFLEKVQTGPAVLVSRDGRWLYWPTRGLEGQQRLLRAPIR